MDEQEKMDKVAEKIDRDTQIRLGRQKRIIGSREEDEVAGFFVFSHIRMRG